MKGGIGVRVSNEISNLNFFNHFNKLLFTFTFSICIICISHLIIFFFSFSYPKSRIVTKHATPIDKYDVVSERPLKNIFSILEDHYF